MDDNSFEKFPGEATASTEAEMRAAEWESAMSEGVPEFAGDSSGSFDDIPPAEGAPAAPGEIPVTTGEAPDVSDEQDNKGLIDAAAIVNYGLNAAARQYGVEVVVQRLKSFDVSGSEHPIHDFFAYLGVDTPAEFDEVRLEREALRPEEADFYANSEVSPATKRRTPEGAFKAIKDMKELILEVEGADPRYEGLRQAARAAGKGYFEYAVGSQVNRSLTDLFTVLAAQPEPEEKPESQPEVEAQPGAGKKAENAPQEADIESQSENKMNPEISLNTSEA